MQRKKGGAATSEKHQKQSSEQQRPEVTNPQRSTEKERYVLMVPESLMLLAYSQHSPTGTV